MHSMKDSPIWFSNLGAEDCSYGIWWVEAMDTTKRHIMHSSDPITRTYSAQNVNSAVAEKQ